MFNISPPVSEDGKPVILTEESVDLGLVVYVPKFYDVSGYLLILILISRPLHYNYVFTQRFPEAAAILEHTIEESNL